MTSTYVYCYTNPNLTSNQRYDVSFHIYLVSFITIIVGVVEFMYDYIIMHNFSLLQNGCDELVKPM
jgi:hypothetical protein